VYALLIPLAGLGTFVVFLALQPLGWKTLKELVVESCVARVCCHCQYDQNDHLLCCCKKMPSDGNIDNGSSSGDGGQNGDINDVNQQHGSRSSSSSSSKESLSNLRDASFVSSITTASSMPAFSLSSSASPLHLNVNGAGGVLRLPKERGGRSGEGEEGGEEGPSSSSLIIIDNENTLPCTENAYATNKASSMPRDSIQLVNDLTYGDFDDDELVSIIVSNRATIQMEMTTYDITQRVSRIFESQDV